VNVSNLNKTDLNINKSKDQLLGRKRGRDRLNRQKTRVEDMDTLMKII
jgi:hypothetical protein